MKWKIKNVWNHQPVFFEPSAKKWASESIKLEKDGSL
jgi:hypothetical protein